jgi:Baseplate J-like protein
MSCTGSQDCTCGCCSGISVQTPQGETNLPGLSSIAYRTGKWATFRESMLARLSSADYPALALLKTRDNDDFSIAFLDATSVMLDILTFYQERLANESYLRTATQLDSLTHLSRLIGYQPSPGVSASTYLAFTIRAATGLPTDPTTGAITIPVGTQAQSVPAQGQSPQSFETSSDILAKADWNALPVQTGVPWKPESGNKSVYLAGTSTQLQPGDAILIVGDERLKENAASEQWDVRVVSSVQTDNVNLRTLVTWSEPLGSGSSGPAQVNPALYALRQRAALFGYNAVNPLMMASTTLCALQNAGLVSTTSPVDWDFGTDNSTSPGTDLAGAELVDLDAVYSKLVAGGWLVLIKPDADRSRSPAGFVSLYLLKSVTPISRSDYGISAKISRVMTDTGTSLSEYYGTTRQTSVLTQSEQLPVAEQPLDHPLYGTLLDLEVVRSDLAGVTAVAITGKSQKLTIKTGVKPLTFVPDDGSEQVQFDQGYTVTLIQPPDFLYTNGTIPDWRWGDKEFDLYVADVNGRTGTLKARLRDFTLALTTGSDPVVQEFALVSSVAVVGKSFPHTRIVLKNYLLNCYDRTVTTVNANVGPATAGASVTELLGSGSAATPNQEFALKQSPLTYVQAPTPTGSSSTLQVTANGVKWTGVATLYQQAPTAQVFATLNLPGGIAKVKSGDGIEGATFPTGQGNIQASYRVGIGAAGNVGAGAITTLVSRPLGVSGVNNPLPATGGQDPQSIDDIRSNAPLSVLTLGRAVSITDYQSFAATFAGIAKAYAIWIPYGAYRGVFITLAGAGGAALMPGNPTLANLVTALQSYGNPSAAIYPQTFLETTFSLSADLCYDPAYDATAVQAAVLQLLQQTYGFASRTFGQGVSDDEIEALIQGVPGIIAVNLTKLDVVATSSAGDLGSAAYSVSAYNNWLKQRLTTPLPRPCAGSATTICPYIPVASPCALPPAAEILVLDPDPKKVTLGVMA